MGLQNLKQRLALSALGLASLRPIIRRQLSAVELVRLTAAATEKVLENIKWVHGSTTFGII